MKQLRLDIKDFFKGLVFHEEGHKYVLEGEKLNISVSGLIKPYSHPTDWDRVLKETAIRKGVTIEEEAARWKKEADIGCEIGSVAHLFGEKYALDRTLKPSSGYEEAIVKFWNDLPDFIVPLFLELEMYHKDYLFGGTADIILYNKRTKTITIGDYKTNKDLFKNFKQQKMQAPFEHLICCPYNHYQLQLSFYQILLEQFLKDTDIKVVARRLIWIKPDATYDIYDLDDYTDVLREQLKIKYK